MKCPKCGSEMKNDDCGLSMDLWFCKNSHCENREGIKGYVLEYQRQHQQRLNKVLEKFEKWNYQYLKLKIIHTQSVYYDRKELKFYLLNYMSFRDRFEISLDTVESLINDLEEIK